MDYKSASDQSNLYTNTLSKLRLQREMNYAATRIDLIRVCCSSQGRGPFKGIALEKGSKGNEFKSQHSHAQSRRAFYAAFLVNQAALVGTLQQGGPGYFMVVVYRFACFMAPNFPKAASHGDWVHCLTKTVKPLNRHPLEPITFAIIEEKEQYSL